MPPPLSVFLPFSSPNPPCCPLCPFWPCPFSLPLIVNSPCHAPCLPGPTLLPFSSLFPLRPFPCTNPFPRSSFHPFFSYLLLVFSHSFFLPYLFPCPSSVPYKLLLSPPSKRAISYLRPILTCRSLRSSQSLLEHPSAVWSLLSYERTAPRVLNKQSFNKSRQFKQYTLMKPKPLNNTQ